MVTGGGAATASGMDFQNRVAAWVAVHVLAEKDAGATFGLPNDVFLEWLRCETGQSVDDLVVGTSAGGFVFIQAKRRIQLSASKSSEFASVIDQFVRQFISCRNHVSATPPFNRPLDKTKDRLVLVTSSSSSARIREDLVRYLNVVQDWPQEQDLATITLNKSGSIVFSTLVELVNRSWERCTASKPSRDEIRELLGLIKVEVIDVVGGVDEKAVKALLKAAVLASSNQDELAWSKLNLVCAEMSVRRSGAGRSELSRMLQDAGVRVRPASSYSSDILKLQKYSKAILRALEDLAEIRISIDQTVRIERPAAMALAKSVEQGSILVVGEPGSGKSGVLHTFASSQSENLRDFIFLAVDRLSSRSIGELRGELGLEHELVDVLENWAGSEPAFLIIDALDAARAEPAAAMIRDLVKSVLRQKGRWKVVASIRKFDLRYGTQFKTYFAGDPVTDFSDKEFANIRHLKVSPLTENELDSLLSQSSELRSITNNATKELQGLLYSPFNLRLLGELLLCGVDVEALRPIKTQAELLERYWLQRVIKADGFGDAREIVLHKISGEMIRTRDLHANRLNISDGVSSEQLNNLLSSQLLVEWQSSLEVRPDRYIIAFSHHVLFDYTVARLHLRLGSKDFAALVSRDLDLTVVLRPSMVIHFEHLWLFDGEHSRFWDLVFQLIEEPKVPQIGKLIGPVVAAEQTREKSDLDLLCSRLKDLSEKVAETAEQALKHVIGAVVAGSVQPDTLVGDDAGPWCELLEFLTRAPLKEKIVYIVRPLLSTVSERYLELTTSQQAAVGSASRRILEFAWSQPIPDQWLVIVALQTVCRTFESNSFESSRLIEQCLEKEHLAQFYFKEMPWLTMEVGRLIRLDLGLVAKIYQAAFEFDGTSSEVTAMGSSQIISLRSTRQQDFEIALYELAKRFPEFLNQSPEFAVRTLIVVLEAYVRKNHPRTSYVDEKFELHGKTARFLTDLSAIWDSDLYEHDNAMQMLRSFIQHIEVLAEEQATDALREILEVLCSENRLAVLWRRLIGSGARYPHTLGRMLLPLAKAVPILTSIDTSVPIGDFIKAISGIVSPSELLEVEQIVLTIPQGTTAELYDAKKDIRDRLLCCFGELVTAEAKAIVKELQNNNEVPANYPPYKMETWSREFTEEDHLISLGVQLDSPATRRLLELELPVKTYANTPPGFASSDEDCREILSALEGLRDFLTKSDKVSLHSKQAEYAWGYFSAACSRIAENLEDAEGTVFQKVLDYLIEASEFPVSLGSIKSDSEFDDAPSWGYPNARIEAAQGLLRMTAQAKASTPQVVKVLRDLIADPDPAVRFQIVHCLQLLNGAEPDLMWSLMDHVCANEKSRSVLEAFLVGPVQRLIVVNEQRCLDYVSSIFKRVRNGSGASNVRGTCVRLFVYLHIWRGNLDSKEILDEIVRQPVDYSSEISYLISGLREPLSLCQQEQPNISIIERAADLLSLILKEVMDAWRKFPFPTLSEVEHLTVQSLARTLDHIGKELYFASGAYERRNIKRLEDDERTISLGKAQFFKKTKNILDQLAESGLPSVSHYLLQTLEHLVSVDPPHVFLCIGKVVQGGAASGYQYESLAADLIVSLVEYYLAEYRVLFRENIECRNRLIDILDIFVSAGWPSAQRLTYRLEEIYR